MSIDNLPIRVLDPKRLPGWEIPAQRIPLGIPGDYKPTMAMLPNGELIMMAFIQEVLPGNKIREWTPIWRSKDGGKTWSERKIIEEMIGREHWLTCTSDGILFATCHHLSNDPTNPDGITRAYVHRSVDGGVSWERTKIVISDDILSKEEVWFGCGPEDVPSLTSRNVIEMPDGALLLGVSANATGYGSLWRSDDCGQTWQPGPKVNIAGYYNNLDGFFTEDFTYRNRAGKLIHWIRVGHPSTMATIHDGRTVLANGNDNLDRMMICESNDGGQTWEKLRDFGDYGMMWPRLLRLRDGRLLLNFTQRAVYYPIGLRAIISYDDGETWDFNSDMIVIEGKTPWGAVAGGAFGNTVQLADDSLVSCYSYRGSEPTNAQTHVEVVRWSLP